MNTTMDKSRMTIQPNAYEVASDGKNNGIAFFNDSIRDGIKGSVFSDTDTGFVSGKAGQEGLIAHNVLGCRYDADADTTCWNGNAQDHYADAGQVVNYAEIHDNMTLYDKLRASVPTDDDATTVARAKLADSIVYLSEGIPAIQLGQEFLRTKGGNGNSYNTGDAMNAIDWDRTTQYADSVDYVKGLIKLRKQIKALRLTDYDDIGKDVKLIKSADGVVAYQVKDESGTYVVIFNANADAAKIEGLDSGSYKTLIADGKVNAVTVTVDKDGSYAAGALSATVLQLDTAKKDGGKADNGKTDNGKTVPVKPSSNKPSSNGAKGASAASVGVAVTGTDISGIMLVAVLLAIVSGTVLIVRSGKENSL